MDPADAVLLTTPRFRVETATRRSPDGTIRQREIVRHPGAVTILPWVDDQHVCLIRNYRLAVGQCLVELPAGTLEAGEDPQETARRELEEETGYRAASLRRVHSFFLSPGIMDEQMHLFVATELVAGDPRREPGEEIENLVVPWEQALAMVREGQIEDAKTIVGLLLYHSLRVAGASSSTIIPEP